MAKTAVEEIVRYASPVIHFRRTATADTELHGVTIAEGDKVVLWYGSANRDEDVFADPYALRRAARAATRRSATAPAGPTSAWAPTWPGGRSP